MSRNPGFLPDYKEIKALDPGPRTGHFRGRLCRGDVIRPPIRVENMKRANAPSALSGPRFSRPSALPEASDSPVHLFTRPVPFDCRGPAVLRAGTDGGSATRVYRDPEGTGGIPAHGGRADHLSHALPGRDILCGGGRQAGPVKDLMKAMGYYNPKLGRNSPKIRFIFVCN